MNGGREKSEYLNAKSEIISSSPKGQLAKRSDRLQEQAILGDPQGAAWGLNKTCGETVG
jgi:hypothetical protein